MWLRFEEKYNPVARPMFDLKPEGLFSPILYAEVAIWHEIFRFFSFCWVQTTKVLLLYHPIAQGDLWNLKSLAIR